MSPVSEASARLRALADLLGAGGLVDDLTLVAAGYAGYVGTTSMYARRVLLARDLATVLPEPGHVAVPEALLVLLHTTVTETRAFLRTLGASDANAALDAVLGALAPHLPADTTKDKRKAKA